MVVWRAPVVEAVLGVSLEKASLTETVIKRLVIAGARESEQLDFKFKPHLAETSATTTPDPAKGWSPEQEFAKDICSFANHLGGVLIIGVRDEHEVAVEAKPTVSDAGAVEQRLRQALLNFSTPTPQFHCIPIESEDGGCYLALVVPPSPTAPHAVRGAVGNTRRPLHYPVRDGADTRWLLEHEVADRYRARTAGRDEQNRRRDEAVSQGLEALQRANDDGLWLYVAITPEAPTGLRLDQPTTAAMKTWLRKYAFMSPLGRMLYLRATPTPGPGRLTVSGAPAYRDHEEDVDPRDEYLELYVDGRAFVATPIEARTSDDSPAAVGELTLTDDAVMLTDLAVSWASHQAGAWGTADLDVGLARKGESVGVFADPVSIHSTVSGSLRRIKNSRPVRGPIRASTSADLSVVQNRLDRLRVARDVLTVLLHHFGISEPRQLQPDGAIVLWAWGRSHERDVEAWALDNQIPVQKGDHTSWQ